MKSKKNYVIISLFFIIGIILGVVVTNKIGKENAEEFLDNGPKQIKHEDALSMMVEQTAGAGDYKMETRTSWPTDGYMFNASLSKCENGGELSWDDVNSVVLMTGNTSDRCYAYFDIYSVAVVNSVLASTTYNRITLTATATKGTNDISKYYYSIDGGSSYSESTSNTYTFSSLSANTTYNIKVKIGDTLGKVGDVYSTTVTTSNAIQFTISGTTYYADPEMTWGSWVNSSYNKFSSFNSGYNLTIVKTNVSVTKDGKYSFLSCNLSNVSVSAPIIDGDSCTFSEPSGAIPP